MKLDRFYPLSILLLICVAAACVQAQAKLIAFEKEQRWGYRDERGKTVIDPRFILANEFSPQAIAAVLDDAGWAYIDAKGNVIIRPFVFDNGPDYFQEGLARFVKNGKFGFFDKTGKTVIEASFDFAMPFHEGLSAVCAGYKQESDGEHGSIAGCTWGYINKNGKTVINLKYEQAGDFKKAKARVKLDGRWVFINKKGEIIKSPGQTP